MSVKFTPAPEVIIEIVRALSKDTKSGVTQDILFYDRGMGLSVRLKSKPLLRVVCSVKSKVTGYFVGVSSGGSRVLADSTLLELFQLGNLLQASFEFPVETVEVLVEDGTFVEYGAELMTVAVFCKNPHDIKSLVKDTKDSKKGVIFLDLR